MTSTSDGKADVLIIGAGVTGLTSALVLGRQGYRVTVVADRFAPHVTSIVAGALWEWPPAVCGYHHDQTSLTRSKKWCAISYDLFAGLSRNPNTGVFMRRATFYFKRPVEDSPQHLVKMNELKEKVDGFIHDRAQITRNGINPAIGLADAYSHLAPMVDTDVYLRWLLDQARRAGCQIVRQRIPGTLQEQERLLRKQFHVDAIVNCAGLGAKELANDAMYPLRGALIRVRNDGRALPRLTAAHCVAYSEANQENGFIFVVPRGRDMLVLGGLAEPNEWNLDIGLDSYEPVRKMYNRCVEFMPMLRNAKIDQAEPVRVGLRPMRRDNVRLGQEPGTCIIHNYGHGGSGVTLSWGCALEVAEQVGAVVGQPALERSFN
jgi:D-amino-acid oxidase